MEGQKSHRNRHATWTEDWKSHSGFCIPGRGTTETTISSLWLCCWRAGQADLSPQEDTPIQIPEPVHGFPCRNVAGVIKALGKGEEPVLSGGPNVITRVLIRGRREGQSHREGGVMAEVEFGVMLPRAKEYKQLLKKQEIGFSRSVSRCNTALRTSFFKPHQIHFKPRPPEL